MPSYRSHEGRGTNEVRDRTNMIREFLRECKYDLSWWSGAP
jgi:hypothetical protein